MISQNLLLALLSLTFAQAGKAPKPVTKAQNPTCRLIKAVRVDNSMVGIYLEKSDHYTVQNTGREDIDVFNTSSKVWVDENNNGQQDTGESWFSNRPFRVGDAMYKLASIEPNGSKPVLELVKEQPMGVVVGRKAPTFFYIDQNGKPARNADYKGKYLLVHVFSYTCHTCVSEWAKLDKIQKRLGDKKMAILLVSVDRTAKGEGAEEAVKNMLDLHSIVWPAAVDDKGWTGVQSRFNVSEYSMVLIGPTGKVVGTGLNAKTVEKLLPVK